MSRSFNYAGIGHVTRRVRGVKEPLVGFVDRNCRPCSPVQAASCGESVTDRARLPGSGIRVARLRRRPRNLWGDPPIGRPQCLLLPSNLSGPASPSMDPCIDKDDYAHPWRVRHGTHWFHSP